MSGSVISGSDRSVGLQRTNQGLLAVMQCPACENENRVVLRWPEVRQILEGFQVQGVFPTGDGNGWQVAVECYIPGCEHKFKFYISSDELEDQAQKEVKRRQRMGVR